MLTYLSLVVRTVALSGLEDEVEDEECEEEANEIAEGHEDHEALGHAHVEWHPGAVMSEAGKAEGGSRRILDPGFDAQQLFS